MYRPFDSPAWRSTRGVAGAHGHPRVRVLGVQILLVLGAALAYFAVRGLTHSDVGRAHANAETVIDIERSLGLAWEEGIQRVVVEHEWLLDLANWIYIYGHWPVVAGTLILLFLWAPDRYYLLRNALFASGAIGLVIFVLVPVAPPRFGLLEVVDTVTERSSSYRTLQPPGLINKYAAMPSLHFGWNLLVGIVLWGTSRHPAVRTFALVTPPAMAFAVVATANHYVLDVMVGAVVALAGLAIAQAVPRVRRTPTWARPPRRT